MSVIETLPETSRISAHGTKRGEYKLLGYKDHDLTFNLGMLTRVAKRIDVNAFHMVREDAVNDVAENLRTASGSIVLAVDPEGRAVGYSSQRILEPRIEGSPTRIMFTSTRAFEAEHENLGLAPATLRMAFNMHNAPELIAGITGMSPVVDVYLGSGIIDGSVPGPVPDGYTEEDLRQMLARVKLFPFYKPYNESEAMLAARDYMIQRTKYKGHEMVSGTGLMKGLFDKDASNLFNPAIAGPRAVMLDRIMHDEYDCDLSDGSAMVIMGVRKGWTRVLVD